MKKRGLTLVELIVTVVVLSLGIVLIYEGFLTTLGGFNYCIDYLNAQIWLDEKIWDVQDKLSHYKTLLTEDTSGTFLTGNKEFNWYLSYDLIEGLKEAGLYAIDLKVSWREGFKEISTARSAYALYLEQ
ncbi:MAG: prepilin-type N-terminal cleavage/methylation domain-containing protein [Candidatus Omnitrophica bacterium]|nr:prepilin-type N-terminal cleavage/methylation domain-containing protein [Candidatus Omnitrophota bacterium]